METIVLKAALQYVAWGLPIIPICSHDHKGENANHLTKCSTPGKAPVVAKWTDPDYGLYVSPERVVKWFQENPGRNIGLPLGSVSGFIGVDIDGAEGELFLSRWSRGDLPPTVEFKTGSGRRLLYRMPFGFVPKKKILFNMDGKDHEEVALLGQGQQTVLPPSIHNRTGKSYEYVQGYGFHNFVKTFTIDEEVRQEWLKAAQVKNPDLTIDKIPTTDIKLDLELIPIAPIWMLDLMDGKRKAKTGATFAEADDDDIVSTQVEPEEWTSTVSEGGRHNTLLRLTGSLIRSRISDPYFRLTDAIIKMHEHNTNHFVPPLAADEVTKAVSDIWSQEALKQKRRKSTFIPLTIALQLIDHLEQRGDPLRYVGEEEQFYQYTDTYGGWKKLIIHDVEAIVSEFLVPRDKTWVTTQKIAEIINRLRTVFNKRHKESAFLFDVGAPERRTWLKDRDADPFEWIAVNNGMLHWPTRTLHPFDPKYYNMSKLKVDFIANATCPMWDQAIDTWIEQDNIEFLQMFSGSTLVPMRVNQVMYLIGDGANGKSMFAETLASVFDDKLVGRNTFSQLMERFGVYDLKNKLVNVCTDDSTKWLRDTGTLKAAITGEPVKAEIKMKQHTPTIYPVCKFIVCSNDFPRTSDKSFGWNRRLSFIPFPRNFIKEMSIGKRMEFDEKFEIALTTEASGRLNWLLEGLQKLADRGFKLPHADEEIKLDYMTDNDDVVDFAHTVLEESEEGQWINDEYVYMLYLTYCDKNRIKSTVKPRAFTKRMKGAGYSKGARVIVRDGKKTSTLSYLRVRLRQSRECVRITRETYSDIPMEELGSGALVNNQPD